MNLSEIIDITENTAVYDCGDNTVMYVKDNSDLKRFGKICSGIESLGYTLSDESETEGNVSRTYLKDNLIHIYYVPCERKTRIIVDGITNAFNFESVKRNGFAPRFIQYEVDHSLIDCGMCYIMTCDDGSFILLDSPHWYSVNDDIRIIEFLTKLSGGKKPHVAAWLFSHAHEDHIGKFNSVLEFYSDKIEIESVCFNFISPACDMVVKEQNVISGMSKFRSLLSEHKEIKTVKPHTGMKICIRNWSFTVLCTQEDIFPGPIDNFNDTSTVYLAECYGTRIMLPGDASELSDRVLLSRYHETLSCDIIQISHHGHSGLSPEFYRRAGAECALFPVTQIKFDEEYDRQESNRTAIEIAGEYYIASNGTAEIPLPYSKGNVIIHPDETFEDFEGIFNLWNYEYTEEYKAKLLSEFKIRSSKQQS